MTDSLALPDPKKNPEDGKPKTGKMVAVALGTIGVIALVYWLTMGEAKADEPAPSPEPKPDPGPQPGPEELYVSDDCKTVVEGSNWWLGWAKEPIIEAVYGGMGGPLLSNDPNVLNRSTNVVVRAILQPWTDCAVKIPWSDWYVASNPVPVPQEGQNSAQFLQLMDNHRDTFVAELVQSIQQYPQLNAIVGKISTGIMAVFLDRYKYDPTNLEGTDLGGSVGKLNTQQKARLMKMGYAITDEVIEWFQADFNTVMQTWVGTEWFIAGMDVPASNEMDNVTDDALAFAFRSSKGIPWQAMVAQSTGVSSDGSPPKQQPDATV